ncbi:MAG TPA: hypothetical protein GXZ90_07735 [Clostridiales bacterium]|nr:hypothetical protein [Clostridiales bacterium]
MQIRNDNYQSASITVFLSLVLLIIISLILVTLEGARLSVARSYINRSLIHSMDSLLAEYHAPLLNEYHIFALDSTYGTGNFNEVIILDKFQEFFKYSVTQDESGWLNNGMDLLDISLENTELLNKTSLLDHDGILYENQVLEYMKYASVGNLIESITAGEEAIKEANETAKVYEKKQEVEEELVEIDKSILELMTLLDGVETNKNGIKLSKKNKLSIKSNFVKNITVKNITMDNAGINNNTVFAAVKGKYVNPMEHTKLLRKVIDKIINLETLRDGGGPEMKIIYNEILTIYYNQLNGLNISLNNLINTKTELIDKSIEVINKIEEKKGNAIPLLDIYEGELLNKKDAIREDVYSGLDQDLSKMKEYTNNDVEKYDFSNKIVILQANRQIIAEASVIVNEIKNLCNKGNYESLKSKIKEFENCIKQYNIKDLRLDYSSLVLRDKKQENPLDKLKASINNGILGLVTDIDNISEKEISLSNLPSEQLKYQSKEININSLFKNMDLFNASGSKDIFSTFIDNNEVISLLNKAMITEYINLFFSNYTQSNEEGFDENLTALSYEQEYILKRKGSDKENLSSVINQILLMRLIMNFISVLGNSQRCTDAELIAVSLVGFTGLPILVKTVKTILLLIISFVESLIDISALLSEKHIKIIKPSAEIIANYQDIFLLNREHIKGKAEKINGDKAFGKLSYDHYVVIFLFMTKKINLRYNSMDLIQKNINLRYDENFLLSNCIFDINIKVKGNINSKFFDLSMLNNSNSNSIYRYTSQSIYSY